MFTEGQTVRIIAEGEEDTAIVKELLGDGCYVSRGKKPLPFAFFFNDELLPADLADRSHFVLDTEAHKMFTDAVETPLPSTAKLEALAARTPPWEPIPGAATVEYRDAL